MVLQDTEECMHYPFVEVPHPKSNTKTAFPVQSVLEKRILLFDSGLYVLPQKQRRVAVCTGFQIP